MSDNVSITPGAGNVVAADEVIDGTLGTVKVQYVKIMDGTLDGTSKATVGANGLQVSELATTNGTQKSQIVNSSGTPVDARVIGGTPVDTDVGLVTNSIIYGHTTAGGGSYVEVKVTPSGALNADVSGSSVSVSNFPATQPISGSVSVSNFPADQLVSIDRSGRTPVLKTGTLVTTATTADQVILTYTVTAGKTLWLEYYGYDTRLTILSATASILGTASLEMPSGTKVFTSTETNPTTSQTGMRIVTFSEPIPVTAGTVIRVVCTPAANTSMTWIANFGGYES